MDNTLPPAIEPSQLTIIPFKQPTAAQQKHVDRRRDNKIRCKQNASINPYVTLGQFEANYKAQQSDKMERTQRVVEQRKNTLDKAPMWMRESLKLDLHDTLSNNSENQKRTSTRRVKPSQKMIDSMNYQRIMKLGHRE